MSFDFLDALHAVRRDLHQHPETGFDLDRTKSIVRDWLAELGIETHVGAGVVGVLKAGSGNRAIAIRADMDALPITEQTGLPYASMNSGTMHACGHDGHTAMLLGAARALAENPDFAGTAVFVFQPNEEHGLGAKAMLDEGFLQQFPVDEIYAIHNLPGAPLGQISTRPGLICASESLFEIEIQGRGGHASMPHVGVDALTVGAEMVLALQTIIARKIRPGSGAVLSITELNTDGARNVLPGTAILKGDVRAQTTGDRQAIEHFMQQITSGIAQAHNVERRFDFRVEFNETINAGEPTDAAVRAARSVVPNVNGNREPMSFSEDFGQFTDLIPGCFLLIGNGTDGAHGQPLHSPNYDFNDELLAIGTEFWQALVKDRLRIAKD